MNREMNELNKADRTACMKRWAVSSEISITGRFKTVEAAREPSNAARQGLLNAFPRLLMLISNGFVICAKSSNPRLR
jgi:hypothetical protein